MSMRPFLSHISAISPIRGAKPCAPAGVEWLFLSWDQAGDGGEFCRDLVAMTGFGNKISNVQHIQQLCMQILPFFHPLHHIFASASVKYSETSQVKMAEL